MCWKYHKSGYITRNCRMHTETDHAAAAVGKLDSSCTQGRLQEDGNQSMAHTKILSPIPTRGYCVDGELNGITTSFLLDTGASTTLLRKGYLRASQSNFPEETDTVPGASQSNFPEETDTVPGAEASQRGWIPIAGPLTSHG